MFPCGGARDPVLAMNAELFARAIQLLKSRMHLRGFVFSRQSGRDVELRPEVKPPVAFWAAQRNVIAHIH